MTSVSVLSLVALAVVLVGLPNMSRAEEGEKLQVSEKQPFGKYLADDEGRAIYLFTADSKGKSYCNDACVQVWPPLITSGPPKAETGVNASMIGTIKRPDGKLQVTYAGMPLYYYARDQKAGSTTGQDLKQFGGDWYLVSPNGREIEKD